MATGGGGRVGGIVQKIVEKNDQICFFFAHTFYCTHAESEAKLHFLGAVYGEFFNFFLLRANGSSK